MSVKIFVRFGIAFVGVGALVTACGCSSKKSSNASPSCSSYCTTLMASCTGGANAQFATQADCEASCAFYPVGTAADTAGNTRGCRAYHATAAGADPATHCVHAGPDGGGVCGTDHVASFCQLVQGACTGVNAVYTDLNDCVTQGGLIPNPPNRPYIYAYDAVYGTANTAYLTCHEAHATSASTVPADHCINDLLPAATTCSNHTFVLTSHHDRLALGSFDFDFCTG